MRCTRSLVKKSFGPGASCSFVIRSNNARSAVVPSPSGVSALNAREIDRLAQPGQGPRDQRAQLVPLPRRGDTAVGWATSEPSVVARRVDLAPDRAERAVEVGRGRSPARRRQWRRARPTGAPGHRGRGHRRDGRSTNRSPPPASISPRSAANVGLTSYSNSRVSTVTGNWSNVVAGSTRNIGPEACRHRRLLDVGDGQVVVRVVDAFEPQRADHDRQRDAHHAEGTATMRIHGESTCGRHARSPTPGRRPTPAGSTTTPRASATRRRSTTSTRLPTPTWRDEVDHTTTRVRPGRRAAAPSARDTCPSDPRAPRSACSSSSG